MHGPEILLAGEKQTTAKSLPALPEMRPAAIWHEGIQLILLTFPLGNKCLEIVWPKAFDQKKTHSQKEPPTPIRQIRGLGARNRGMALKTRRGVCGPRVQQTGRPGKGKGLRDIIKSVPHILNHSKADPAQVLAKMTGPGSSRRSRPSGVLRGHRTPWWNGGGSLHPCLTPQCQGTRIMEGRVESEGVKGTKTWSEETEMSCLLRGLKCGKASEGLWVRGFEASDSLPGKQIINLTSVSQYENHM